MCFPVGRLALHCCSLIVLLVVGISPAMASVTVGSPSNGVTTTGFAGVGMFGDVGGYHGSGVAIADGRYVLTARHNVTLAGTIGGAVRSASTLRFRIGDDVYNGISLYASFGADLALVEVDRRVPVRYGLWTDTHGSELSWEFIGVGYGDTDPDGNQRWGPGGYGTRRTFSNIVNTIHPGAISGQGVVLRYDFDADGGEGPGLDEGLAAPGDSGGGLFLPYAGSSLLAGVLSSAGDPVNGAFGSAVRIADYAAAIAAIVPEPAGSSVTLLIAMVSLLRRRVHSPARIAL